MSLWLNPVHKYCIREPYVFMLLVRELLYVSNAGNTRMPLLKTDIRRISFVQGFESGLLRKV